MEGQGRPGQPQQDRGRRQPRPRVRSPVRSGGPRVLARRPPRAREPDLLQKASAARPARRIRGWEPRRAGPGGREHPTPPPRPPSMFGDSALNPHPVAQRHVTCGDSGRAGLLGPDARGWASGGAQEA